MIPIPHNPAAMERGLTVEKLQRALVKLNGDQRDVIVLRFIAGMPVGEVAQSLNKSEEAVKGLQRRGLVALRNTLKEWEDRYAS